MKSLLKFILIYSITCCICVTVTAQDSIVNKKEMVFPPLPSLIDSAIKHNAAVQYRRLEIEVRESNVTTQRNGWLRNLGVQGDSRYGTIDAFSTNANGVSSNFSNTTSKQLNYAAGVYVKIPIFDLVNRKNQVKQAKTEVEEAKRLAESQEAEIRQIVIKQYQDVILKQKLLTIKSLNLGSATVNMEMVEKEFRNGVIPVTEYVRLSDMTARIQSDYELAKSDFILAKQLLEDTVGFTFANTNSKGN
ncbi:TolC family protein [Ferruginibacter sp. SUN106]|uniref:TolC family protein n=1 Tax=Ferruginibacter sp. SUN106 TaxID=2978348 RepID=UPI003D3652CD